MENKQPERRGLSAEKLRRIFLRRRQTLFLLFFSGTIVMILAAYLLPSRYEARAHLLVKVGQEALTASSMIMPELTPGGADISDQIYAQIQVLRSETLLRKVVDRLGVDRILSTSSAEKRGRSLLSRGFRAANEGMNYLLDRLGLLRRLPPTEQAVRKIEKRLRIQPLPNGPIIRVQLLWSDPRLAAEIVNTLVELYGPHSIEVQQPKGSLELMSEQVDQLDQNVLKANKQLAAYKQKYGITSLPDQQRLLLDRLTQKRSLLQDVEAETAETEGTIRAAEKQLASLAKEVKLTRTEHKNPVYESLRLRESDLEVELANARARYTEESPIVTLLVKQINVVRERLNSEETLRLADVTLGENTTYKALETGLQQDLAHLNGLKMKQKIVEGQIDSITARLAALNRGETELTRLETESSIGLKNYELARDRFETVRVSNIIDQKNIIAVHILERAKIPVRPTRSRLFVMIVGIIGSLFIAVGGVFVSEHFDHSIKDPSDVEQYLRLPTLSVHPQRQGPSVHSQQLFKQASDGPNPTGLGPTGPVKDLYQHIRGHLLSFQDGDQGKTIMVTTSVPQEGGTTVAWNLAIALAGQGNSCLLIDGNLRKPAVHAACGLSRKPGLSDLPSGSIDPISLVKPTRVPHLSVVTSGEGYLDPLDLCVSSLWKDALAAWRARFRWIIIDTAPIQPYAEGTLLARDVDEVILVVAAGATRRELAIDTKQRLEACGGKLLGVVLNQHTQTS